MLRVRILVMVMAVVMAAPARALPLLFDHVVIGDSIASEKLFGNVLINWPEEAFGVLGLNNAVGGASSEDFLAACNPTCWWLADAEPGQAWWFDLAHNDLDLGTAEEIVWDYQLLIINRIIAEGITDVRLIFTMLPQDVLGMDRSADRAKLLEIAAEQQIMCDLIFELRCVLDLKDIMVFPGDYDTDGVHPSVVGVDVIADAVVAVPEPSTSLLMVSGLVALGVISRRRKRCPKTQ